MSSSILQRNNAFHALLFMLFLCGLLPGANAQQTTQKFVQETNYLLSLPAGYGTDTTARWPLLIFLHGSGESGTDIQKVKAHGPPELVEKGKQFPFIIVSPQSDVPNGWDVEMLYKLLQHIKRTFRVNQNKVYLSGLSMGGFGTWSLAMKYPDEFAAIAPVCGGGDTTDIWKLRHIPIWCFHGAKDDVVLPGASEKMVKAARHYNSSVKFTLFPGANHNSWDDTYNKNDSLYDWLLQQSKFYYKEKALTTADLKKYEGFYAAGSDNDTIHIVVENNNLVAKTASETVPLKPAGDHLFFIEPDKNIDLLFINRQNNINSFLFSGGNQVLFRKIK